MPDDLCKQLLAEEVEVASLSHPPGFSERSHATPLYRERYVVAFPAGHRFESRPARPITEPEVTRDVVLLTVAGRPFTPALASFHQAIRRYEWPTVQTDGSEAERRLDPTQQPSLEA